MCTKFNSSRDAGVADNSEAITDVGGDATKGAKSEFAARDSDVAEEVDAVDTPRPAIEDAAVVADANAISVEEGEGDGTTVVYVKDRRILARCSNPPATATTASAVATPTGATGITEGGGGPDGSEWVVGLSEAVNEDPAEAAEDDERVIGAVAGVVCWSFVINTLLLFVLLS